MKLYWLGEGDAALVYVPGGAVTIRKTGIDIPENLAKLILETYKHIVTDKPAGQAVAPAAEGGEN
jgi:hypothetical protein